MCAGTDLMRRERGGAMDGNGVLEMVRRRSWRRGENWWRWRSAVSVDFRGSCVGVVLLRRSNGGQEHLLGTDAGGRYEL